MGFFEENPVKFVIIRDDLGRTLRGLKTVWAPAHKGSNPFPSAISPDFSGLFSTK